MVLRYIIGNTGNRAITTERIKLVAGGCQLIAVGTVVAAVLAPSFNPAIATTLRDATHRRRRLRLLRASCPAHHGLHPGRRGGLTVLDMLQNLFVTTGIGFGLVALGLYVERRWIGLPRQEHD